MNGSARWQRIGIVAGLSVVLSSLLPSCSFHDHSGSTDWMPFESISGPLQPQSQNLVTQPPAVGTSLRIVTYNIHMGPDIPGLISAIKGNTQLASADVFFFEEIESHPSDGKSQAEMLAEALGMNYAYAPAWTYPDGGTHGVACLSRFPITEPQVLHLPYYELEGASELRI